MLSDHSVPCAATSIPAGAVIDLCIHGNVFQTGIGLEAIAFNSGILFYMGINKLLQRFTLEIRNFLHPRIHRDFLTAFDMAIGGADFVAGAAQTIVKLLLDVVLDFRLGAAGA